MHMRYDKGIVLHISKEFPCENRGVGLGKNTKQGKLLLSREWEREESAQLATYHKNFVSVFKSLQKLNGIV